ncbi:putative ribonuclease H-like domain-containing protein [Tanacetum coccineum]
MLGTIEEEVYVRQPPGFVDPEFPDKVYKVEKALYGLHQAPRAWYETLSTYLMENRFRRGIIDKTLFIKKIKNDILLVQVLISWQCKKQTIMANSTTKAEYIAASNCYGQVLWLQNQLLDYGYNFMQTKIHVDNESAIYYNVADLLTKASDVAKLQFLIASIGQTTTGKETSNPLMADSLLKTILVDGMIHLQLVDADGISSLPNTEIFDQFSLMGCVSTNDKLTFQKDEAIIKEMHDGLGRATTTASRLEAEQGSGNISKTQTKATPSEPSSLRTNSEGSPWCHFTMRDSPVQARPKRLSNLPNEPKLREGNTSRSGEGSMQLLKLMNICTTLSVKVTALEEEVRTTKVVYNKSLITLTKRVTKLENKLKLKRRSVIVDSSDDEEASLAKEDPSK